MNYLIVAVVAVAIILHFYYPTLGLKDYKVGAQVAPSPNIVFILTDDQLYSHLANMPYLTSKPNGHWVEFTNAFLNRALCCPSRATILSGLYSHHHGIENNDGTSFSDSSTLATWLDGVGYTTALVGKYLNGYPFIDKPNNYIPPGWDKWYGLLNDSGYYNYSLNENGTTIAYGSAPQDYSTDVYASKATSFIASATQPFFLYFSVRAPHGPFTPAPRHIGFYSNWAVPHSPNFNEEDVSDKPLWVRNLTFLTQSEISTQDENQKMASETLLAVDEAIKGIIDALSAKGVLDNTVIFFMSDNGLSFGSHRHKTKNCEFEECIKTPLLIRYPWAEGRVETRLVSNVDIAPTIAELAQATIPYTVDGVSLIPLLTNAAPSWRSGILIRGGGIATTSEFWGVRTDSWKYVEVVGSGEKELYDLISDPYELVSVANQPALAAVQEDLEAKLNELRGPIPTPTPSSDTTAPSVSVTSPKNGGYVKGTTSLKATASDNVGVTRVEFYIDGTFLGYDETSPYSKSWNTALYTNGSHTIFAKAVDGTGNIGTSSTVNVTVDNIFPTVNITAPTNGATVSGIVSINADATDNVGVSKVEFRIDGVLKTTDKTAPYSYSWNTTTYTNGSHSIQVKSYDNAKNITSSTISVNVNN